MNWLIQTQGRRLAALDVEARHDASRRENDRLPGQPCSPAKSVLGHSKAAPHVPADSQLPVWSFSFQKILSLPLIRIALDILEIIYVSEGHENEMDIFKICLLRSICMIFL